VKLRDGSWPAAVELGDESWPAAAAGSGGLRQWRSEKMGGWPRRNEDLVEEDGGNGERRRAAAVHTVERKWGIFLGLCLIYSFFLP
jgi:hypothetical protein